MKGSPRKDDGLFPLSSRNITAYSNELKHGELVGFTIHYTRVMVTFIWFDPKNHYLIPYSYSSLVHVPRDLHFTCLILSSHQIFTETTKDKRLVPPFQTGKDIPDFDSSILSSRQKFLTPLLSSRLFCSLYVTSLTSFTIFSLSLVRSLLEIILQFQCLFHRFGWPEWSLLFSGRVDSKLSTWGGFSAVLVSSLSFGSPGIRGRQSKICVSLTSFSNLLNGF